VLGVKHSVGGTVRAAATACAAVQSNGGPFLSLATGKATRPWSALRTAGLSEPRPPRRERPLEPHGRL